MKKKDLVKWNIKYNGAAIYSLVDDKGKRYIGKTIHLQNRLNTHRHELNKVYRTQSKDFTNEGQKLVNAALNGTVFRVEVLLFIPPESVTENFLRLLECYYYSKYGGLDRTYNSTPPNEPNWYAKDFNERIFVD